MGASEDFEDDGGTALVLSFDFSYKIEGSDDDFFFPWRLPDGLLLFSGSGDEGSGSEGDDASFCGPLTGSESAESNMVDA